MAEYSECETFFTNILLWSLSGLHYPHSCEAMGLARRLQLYDAFVAHPIDFKAFFTQNVRLLFFVVKE